MGSAHKFLLLVLAIATGKSDGIPDEVWDYEDTHMDATLNPLTLSPDADTFITTHENPISTDTSPNTVIDSAAPDSSTMITNSSLTNTFATTAPATPYESDSNLPSTSYGGDQDTMDYPLSDPTTLSPGLVSDRTPSSTAKLPSNSSTAVADSLNHSIEQSSAGGSTGIATALPVVFGALACVGALVMAVMYKGKRDVKENDSCRSSVDWTTFSPENRARSVVQETSSLVAIKTPDIGTHDLNASVSVVNFKGTNSSVNSTSSFGSNRCKVRADFATPSSNLDSEANMDFHDVCPRHEEGIDVMLTFNEGRDSSRLAPQVQL